VEELQSTLQNARTELTREQSALDLSRRRQGDLEQQLQNLDRERSELSQSVETDRSRLAEQRQELEESQELLQAAQLRAQDHEEQVRAKRQSTEGARRSLEQSQRALLQGLEQANELHARSAGLSSRIESLTEQLQRLSEESENAKLRLEEDQTRLSETRAELERQSSERDHYREARNQQQLAIRDLEGTLRQQERAEDESLRELTRQRAKLQSMRELLESHEGMADGPKAILNWASEHGKAGLTALTDLIDVDAGFETAMEGWLEGQLEGLLSKDASLAVEALRELALLNQGRACVRLAGIWPQKSGNTSVTPSEVEALLQQAGFDFVGTLAQHVRANSKANTPLAESALNACHQVALVRDSAPLGSFISSDSFQRFIELGWSLVSLDGIALDLHSAGTAELRGGSLNSNKASSILGRKRAVAELESSVEGAQALHDEHQAQTEKTRLALETARGTLSSNEERLRELEISCGTIERETKQLERTVQDAQQNLERFSAQEHRAQEESTRSQSEMEELSQRLSELLTDRSELEASLKTREAEVHQFDLELRALESELQNLKVGEASVRERAQSLRREYLSLEGVVADRDRRITEIQRLLERATQERSQHSGGDDRSEAKIEELVHLVADLETKLSETKNQLEIVSARVNEGLERIKSLHKKGEAKNQNSMSLALEIEKLNGDFAHLNQNLEEKYGVDCLITPASAAIQEEMEAPVVTAEMTAEEEKLLNEEVERIRERIRRLGEVNPMAEQEFNDLQRRFEHLCAEKRDLERSLENLQEAIEHINKTSEERFRKAFEAIADRFEKLFPIIFGGGQAKLSLVYPEGSTEILDAGVDILAQPPGKKIVNMQALSGGEKALTAVSMIFAIFMVKPSPFCVLDEVDAPLDDANVGKFNALLREMSVKSQFILITHNKKTMELNDTLYGVTMEEPGVSKMVSVRMH
jgi:chromosome segregation protein